MWAVMLRSNSWAAHAPSCMQVLIHIFSSSMFLHHRSADVSLINTHSVPGSSQEAGFLYSSSPQILITGPAIKYNNRACQV